MSLENFHSGRWTNGRGRRLVRHCVSVSVMTILGGISACSSSSEKSSDTTTASPGFLTIGPQGLTLAPSASKLLVPKLFDSYGNTQPLADPIAWTSSNSAIVTVASDGTVTAVAAGTAAVTAIDGMHRSAVNVVSVGDDAVGGSAAAIAFDPPITQLAVGADVTFSYSVTDALGSAVSPAANVTFQSFPSGVLQVDSSGAVHASARGLASLLAFLPGQTDPLAGALTVLVGPAGTGTPDAGSSDTTVSACSQQPVLAGCAIANGGIPREMTKPGLTYPASVLAFWTDDPSCPLPIRGFAQQTIPDSVVFKTAGIATYDPASGTVSSQAPGSTTMAVTLRGTDCNGSWNGDPVSVGVDIGGSWSVSDGHGNSGGLCLPAGGGVVLPGQTWGGGTGVISSGLKGTSTIAGTESCMGVGAAGTSGRPGGLSEQLCSESEPCNANLLLDGGASDGVSFTVCAPSEGPAPSTVFGSNHVKSNGFDFTKTDDATCAAASPSPTPLMDPCSHLGSLYCAWSTQCDPSGTDCSPFASRCESAWPTQSSDCQKALVAWSTCSGSSFGTQCDLTATPCYMSANVTAACPSLLSSQ